MTTREMYQIKWNRNHAGNYSVTAADAKYRIVRKGGFWWLLYETDYQKAMDRACGGHPIITTGNAKQFHFLSNVLSHLDKLDRAYWNFVIPF